ncbi:MAG: TlpA family protein disulfide reductase [Bacteroidaceae bacterium]|nr:TlpA family protein disulfide reductase [Bacteroidaceae bacterium]
MNKKTIITLFFAFVTITGWAKEKTRVWEQPTIEYGNSNGDGYFNLDLDVTKVELKETETVVYITASERSDYPDFSFQFTGDTYLKVGETRYSLTSADGIELNKFVQTNKNGKRDMAFHFQPLPQDTKSFDFIEGDGDRAFQIKGIKPVEERWKQLLPSYWRDDKTGNWELALLEDCAIYQCKFWSYDQRDVNPQTGEATLVMRNGNDELKVMVGKNKKGKRTMQIGQQKVTYSMITSRFLPDSPTKDTRTDFVDTGNKTDTVTVVGWLKDMPEEYKQLKTFELMYTDFLTDEQTSAYADLDSLGRFTVKIPVLNSTEFRCDWRRCFIRTMLEAGKTYFMLYDFKEGRRYFMGDDARLQNEIFKYPLDWKSIRLYEGKEGAGEGDEALFTPYIASVDSLIQAQYANTDSLCKAHPTLSTRYYLYRKGNTLVQQARDFGQARFRAKGFNLPDNARQYAHDTFWTKLEKPYTLHSDLSTFLRDYLGDAINMNSVSFNYNSLDLITKLASTDEERAIADRWKSWIVEAQAQVEAASTPEEKQRIAEKLNTDNADMIEKVNAILNGPKAQKYLGGQFLILRAKNDLHALDSIGADPFIKDLWLSRMVYNEIENRRTSLQPAALDTLRKLVNCPAFLERVEQQNNHYLAIENREFDKLVLKSSDNLAELSEGEALLKKLVEPYKGKFVLLDIWGTWCGPCKEALSHSTEEYARLKDYDIEFLYLANESPQESWENTIKEYNVSGDNVAHYNLPALQQSAIERHLDVHSFPTYKLFNRDGHLLDLEVDARDLDQLIQLLEQLK